MMPDWEAVIGLEIHVQLQTLTKLFCGCAAEFGDTPNTNVCPVCLGLPGALPVTNGEAVRHAVRGSLALECDINRRSEFARKNYFYPDLPKGYQISQFDKPIGTGGRLGFVDHTGQSQVVRINRLHLEEDAGKSIHDRFVGKTALDYNRAGVPLAEIVTEPDLRSPTAARLFLDELKLLLQFVAASDCSMEAGRLRVDANLSVRRPGDEELGTKQEVKNMNSFSAVEHALEELKVRQIATLERGDDIEQSTYSFGSGSLRVMRGKEASHDYRYFPDPDLPVLTLDDAFIENERAKLPELPAARRLRFCTEYGVSEQDAGVLTGSQQIADYYEEVVRSGADSRTASHWVMGSVLRDANEHAGALRLAPKDLTKLIGMVEAGVLSNQAAKRVFTHMLDEKKTPMAAAKELGVLQVTDADAVAGWLDSVWKRFPDEVARLTAGEGKLMGFFMGETMKESRGRADPKIVQQLIRDRMA